ncbi:ParB/RepB/Spo0J family partition protein [Paracoccaceae bacterium]|nr:ParB/RepB/Spo0J family partition protein [Paracoccaceae bacterium]
MKEEKISSKNERKKSLGRGLSSLLDIGSVEDIVEKEAKFNGTENTNRFSNLVPIELIKPNKNQPRKSFSADDLNELASSLKETGIIQPILVREKGGFFEIVAGERRWRASQIAKIHEMPVIVKDITDEESVKISIIENIQRIDLNPVEEAYSYNQLIEKFGYTQEKVSNSLGKSRSYIANSLRLLTLNDQVLKLLEKGKITVGHARVIIGLDDAEKLAQRVLKENLSVRQLEMIVKFKKGQSFQTKNKKQEPFKDLDTINLEQDLKMVLGLKTSILHNKDTGGGKISIEYKSLEQLDSFCSKIMKV